MTSTTMSRTAERSSIARTSTDATISTAVMRSAGAIPLREIQHPVARCLLMVRRECAPARLVASITAERSGGFPPVDSRALVVAFMVVASGAAASMAVVVDAGNRSSQFIGSVAN